MPSKFCSLHSHSTYSLLDGLPTLDKIAKRAADVGIPALAVTDHGSASGLLSWELAAKKVGVKPINGVEFYVSHLDSSIKDKSNGQHEHMLVLAKNKEGWKSLLNAVAQSNRNFYKKPRLSLEEFRPYAANGNLIVITGHCGSNLSNLLFTDFNRAYDARTVEEAASYLHPDWEKRAERFIYELRDIFGKENVFVEIQEIDRENLKAVRIISDCLRTVAKKIGQPCVGTADSHFAYPEDAADQRLILCTSLNTTFQKVNAAIANDEEVGLGGFFRSNKYYIPSPEEMAELHSAEEIANSQLIADMCEAYSVCGKPRLPIFPCPDGLSSDEYFKQICRKGWTEKIAKLSGKDVYADRVRYELDTLLPAGLADYFLIVQDYINWTRANGGWIGKARGSAGGCLVSYLSGIIGIDPVAEGLYFERFYNAGRNSLDHTELPDIDTDFEQNFRPKVINYIRETYGNAKVANIANFGRLQGKSAIRAVLSAYDAASQDEMKKISQFIPDEQAISDQLQQMEESGRKSSILMWALEYNAKELSPWCTLNDKGEFEGMFAKYFEQAVRIEGVRKSQGKHASGLIISGDPLEDYVPMVRDKSGEELMVGFEGKHADKAGAPKFDILNTAVIDIMHSVSDTLLQDRSYAN